jgi:TIR domain
MAPGRRRVAKNDTTQPIYFFISRATEDAPVAREVADVLRRNGCGVMYQDEHIPYGSNFVLKMNEFLEQCRHLVVLMSTAYTSSSWCNEEWASFYASKIGEDSHRHLAILTIDECKVPALLKPYVRGSLVNCRDVESREKIIVAATRVNELISAVFVGNPVYSTANPEQMQEILENLKRVRWLRTHSFIGEVVANELERELARRFVGMQENDKK